MLNVTVKLCFIFIGPGYIGDDSFDRECVFGNEVVMNFNQVMLLRSYVEDVPRPKVKVYVSTLTKLYSEVYMVRPVDPTNA